MKHPLIPGDKATANELTMFANWLDAKIATAPAGAGRIPFGAADLSVDQARTMSATMRKRAAAKTEAIERARQTRGRRKDARGYER